MLKKPRAIISITGGATNLDLSAAMRDSLIQDIRMLAKLTRAFIITGGTNSGCMELAGQAACGMGIDCIAIAPLGLFNNHEALQKTSGGPCADFDPKVEKKPYCQLDQNHTHFILLDTQKPEDKGAFTLLLCSCENSDGKEYLITLSSFAGKGKMPFGSETATRAKFEVAFSARNQVQVSPRHDQSAFACGGVDL